MKTIDDNSYVLHENQEIETVYWNDNCTLCNFIKQIDELHIVYKGFDEYMFRKQSTKMLIVDKQRPKTLASMDYHKNISENLIKMVFQKSMRCKDIGSIW